MNRQEMESYVMARVTFSDPIQARENLTLLEEKEIKRLVDILKGQDAIDQEEA